ncbi:ABC transporter substrate-binding protein [Microlunatus parietis]|uniref:Osmoprotectant transport system substrate-binding protein n=1 Tax=Microlunatus parietis TaxID=682979 RepID=A0A7Y9IAW1_9ACTN|nr:ABC transporter substrate-binding protein [Microlunatus parietis]NYE73449.1 osmoprotectant transport system substrate-binding protein [Microlunatus parietis]
MKIKNVTATIAAALLLALAGCAGNSNPLGESAAPSPGGDQDQAPIVVGSANFTESQILGELYAQALQAKGIQASTKLNIGNREVYLKALEEGTISVVPEYTGNLLINYDQDTTAKSAAEVEQALAEALPEGFQVLKSSPAADQDVYVVTKAYADEHGLASLADLKKISAGAILGGPSELATRAYGPEGLEKIYGAKFKEFKPYDAPAVKARDLNDGKIQVATFFTTESVIAANGYVQLADPESMILPQNVVPLVTDAVAGNADAKATLEAVQAALTTEDLAGLNKRVDTDHDDPGQVAGDWLKEKGLA